MSDRPVAKLEAVLEAARKRIAELEEHNRQLQAEIREGAQSWEHYYRRLVETAPGIFYAFSPTSGAIYLSPRAKEILGFDMDLARQNPMLWHDAIHPEDIQAVYRAVEQLQEEDHRCVSYRIKDVWGQWHWIEDRFFVQLQENGQRIIEGMATDITERRKAEDELRVYEQIVSATLDSLSLVSLDWRYLIINNSYSLRTGLPLDQIVGRPVAEVMGREVFETTIRPRFERVARGATERYEEWFDYGLGRKWFMEVAYFPFRDHNGVIRGVLVSAHDSTERKLAEKALLETEGRYRQLFDNAMDAIYLFKFDGGFFDVNRIGHERLGYSKEEILQMNAIDIDAPEYAHLAPVRFELLKKGGSLEFETVHRTRDGRDMPVEIRACMLKFSDAPAVLAIARDISERKAYETNLTQAKDAAEFANRAKSEFLANMSHEIRTPLNSLLAMLQVLQLSRPTEEQLDFIKTAMVSGHGLLSVINDILDLSKIEAGKVTLVEEEFQVFQLIQSVTRTFVEPALHKGVFVHYEFGENVPERLIADCSRLRQILFNLVGNAVKFTQEGEVLTRVRLRQDETRPGMAWLVCGVEDSGIGIPKDKMAVIFDAFSQIDGAYTRRNKGTGLGLAIVQRLVSLMGGTIRVESEEGKGSVFTFEIQVRLPEVIQDVQSQADGRAEGGEANASPCLRVLLVEDDELGQAAIEMLLMRLGHKVAIASNGRQALDRLAAQPFDIVLMDVQMPVMNGIEATRAIRALAAPYANIPIIALTAHAMQGDREAFLEAGMNDYLSKPMSMDSLSRMLQENVA